MIRSTACKVFSDMDRFSLTLAFPAASAFDLEGSTTGAGTAMGHAELLELELATFPKPLEALPLGLEAGPELDDDGG